LPKKIFDSFEVLKKKSNIMLFNQYFHTSKINMPRVLPVAQSSFLQPQSQTRLLTIFHLERIDFEGG